MRVMFWVRHRTLCTPTFSLDIPLANDSTPIMQVIFHLFHEVATLDTKLDHD